MSETDNTVSVETTYENHTIILITKFDGGKWQTAISIDGDKSEFNRHKKPLYENEKSRNDSYKTRLVSKLQLRPQKKADEIIISLTDKAIQSESEIQALENEYIKTIHAEEEQLQQEDIEQREKQQKERMEAKQRRTLKIEELYDILCNKDGKRTVLEIEQAKADIKVLSMFDFWTVEGYNERTGNPGHLSLKKIPIANYIHKAFNIIRFGGRNWWYDWDKAFYTYDNDDALINQEIIEIMSKVGNGGYAYNGNVVSDKSSIIELAVRQNTYIKSPFNKYKNYINVRNGVLELDYKNRKITPIGKKPEFMFNYCIDTIYDENADSTAIDQYVEQILGKDQKELFYQIPAIAIRDLDLDLEPSKICYALVGDKHTGKDSLLNLLRKLFGNSVITSIKLKDISENDHILASIEGKLLNLNGELPAVLPNISTEMMKELTGSKIHNVNPKGIQPYDTVITAIHVFAGNQFPKCRIKENEDAFWDRWEILHFNNPFPINERYNASIFTEQNMSALLNIVINKLFDIYDYGVKRQTIDAYTEWMSDSNSVLKFIRDVMYDTEESYEYLKDDLFSYYKIYCKDIGKIPLEERCHTLPVFGKEIINCGARSKRSRKGEERENVYVLHKKIRPEMVEKLQKVIDDNPFEHICVNDVKPKPVTASDDDW